MKKIFLFFCFLFMFSPALKALKLDDDLIFFDVNLSFPLTWQFKNETPKLFMFPVAVGLSSMQILSEYVGLFEELDLLIPIKLHKNFADQYSDWEIEHEGNWYTIYEYYKWPSSRRFYSSWLGVSFMIGPSFVLARRDNFLITLSPFVSMRMIITEYAREWDENYTTHYYGRKDGHTFYAFGAGLRLRNDVLFGRIGNFLFGIDLSADFWSNQMFNGSYWKKYYYSRSGIFNITVSPFIGVGF